jgi:hypothetical protein
VALIAATGISAIAFVAHLDVPFLDQFDLAVHETGHLLTGFLPELVMFMAGSAAQVLFPLAMAAYFGIRRRDGTAAAFCLAWAGTSARDVSVYAGDAVSQALPLIGGGQHDWAHILGPSGFDALGQTAAVARSIEMLGMFLATAGVTVAAREIVVAVRTRHRIPVFVDPPADREPWVAAASLPFRHERDVA